MRNAAKGIIGLAVVLAALALAPGAGASPIGVQPPTEAATPVHGPDMSGAAGLATGTATDLATRTPTELGQRVPDWGESGGMTNGFDWGDAALGAAMMFGLGVVGFGGLVLLNRRRHTEHGSESRLASA